LKILGTTNDNDRDSIPDDFSCVGVQRNTQASAGSANGRRSRTLDAVVSRQFLYAYIYTYIHTYMNTYLKYIYRHTTICLFNEYIYVCVYMYVMHVCMYALQFYTITRLLAPS
jgi:hypothetical protein